MVNCDGLLALISSADRAAERAIEQLNYVPLLPPNTPKGAQSTISDSPGMSASVDDCQAFPPCVILSGPDVSFHASCACSEMYVLSICQMAAECCRRRS